MPFPQLLGRHVGKTAGAVGAIDIVLIGGNELTGAGRVMAFMEAPKTPLEEPKLALAANEPLAGAAAANAAATGAAATGAAVTRAAAAGAAATGAAAAAAGARSDSRRGSKHTSCKPGQQGRTPGIPAIC